MLLLKNDLRGLVENTGEPCISLFAPMEEAGPATRQNKIRFKNVLGRAEERLISGGVRPGQARELLDPVRARIDDEDFWQHQSGGLAVFRSPGIRQEYRIPLQFDELAIVGSRFHIKP